jgi:hypothetical protein
VDGNGTMLARIAGEDGEGIIIADITPGAAGGDREPIPGRFWIPELWEPLLRAWEKENAIGIEYYQETARPHYKQALARDHNDEEAPTGRK